MPLLYLCHRNKRNVYNKINRYNCQKYIYFDRCAERASPSPPLQSAPCYDYHLRGMPGHSSTGPNELAMSGGGPALRQHNVSPLVYDHLSPMGPEVYHAGMMGRGECAYGFDMTGRGAVHPGAYYDQSQCRGALPVASPFSVYSSAGRLAMGNSPPTEKSSQLSPSGRCTSDDILASAKPQLVEITPILNPADHKNASYINLQNAWRKPPPGDPTTNSDDDVTCQQDCKRRKIVGSGGDLMSACHEQSPEQTVPGSVVGRNVICPRGSISLYGGNVTAAMGYSPDSYSPGAPGYYNYYAQPQTDTLASCSGYS